MIMHFSVVGERSLGTNTYDLSKILGLGLSSRFEIENKIWEQEDLKGESGARIEFFLENHYTKKELGEKTYTQLNSLIEKIVASFKRKMNDYVYAIKEQNVEASRVRKTIGFLFKPYDSTYEQHNNFDVSTHMFGIGGVFVSYLPENFEDEVRRLFKESVSENARAVRKLQEALKNVREADGVKR